MRSFLIALALAGAFLLPTPSEMHEFDNEPVRAPLSRVKKLSTIPLRSEGKVEAVAVKQPPVPKISGNWVAQCKQWAAQAGLTWNKSMEYIIDHESDCSPVAQNPTSTAYGIGQFLDSTWGLVGCSKSSDPVYQLKCMDKYAKEVRGGWYQAELFKRSNGWY